jgi:hypothetical protein
LNDREINDLYDDLPPWQQNAWKIADFLGNLSLILGGLNSKLTLSIVRWSIQKVFSPEQLERLLIVNVSGEKLHQRIGILSFLLGVPTTLKTCYLIYSWARHPHVTRLEEQEEHFYTPIPIRKIDVVIAVRTVSQTAQKLIKTSRQA